MNDLTAITTPFGLLDRETQEALQAHGGPYTTWSAIMGGTWISCEPQWKLDYVYRVTKPAPPKPREWWAVGLHLHKDEATALTFLAQLNDEHPEMNFGPVIHVREVLPVTN